MCGRYSNHVRAMHDWAALLGDWPEDVALGHNVSPSQIIPVFTATSGAGMRWGLIPVWANEIAGKYATFNARLESVTDKPAFKHAWKHSQRCLVPAEGYYEWRLEQGAKQPYFVHLPPTTPMVMAGLYEPVRPDDFPASCTVLTRAAGGHMARLHNRIPVILPVEQARQWFEATPEQAMEMATADYGLPVDYYPVSKRVNNSRNEDDELTRPVEIIASDPH